MKIHTWWMENDDYKENEKQIGLVDGIVLCAESCCKTVSRAWSFVFLLRRVVKKWRQMV